MVVLFGGIIFIMGYGCVIWGVWLCYLGVWSSLWGMVVLFGGIVFLMGHCCVIWGYSLHYRVWLLFGGMVILFLEYGLHLEVW